MKWAGVWTLPRPAHDLFLLAVATGPAVHELYWPIAKPYQPTSPVVRGRVLGVTGAAWVDADGDGRWTSARGYAERLLREAGGAWSKLVPALGRYDEAVAAQAAALLRARGVTQDDPAVAVAVKKAGPQVERGFQAFREAWRDSQVARQRPR